MSKVKLCVLTLLSLVTYYTGISQSNDSIPMDIKAEQQQNDVIYNEEILPSLTKNTVIDWSTISNTIIKKYGLEKLEFIQGQQMFYYWRSGNPTDSFPKYYKLYFESAIHHLEKNIYHVNNLSWSIFETVNDLDILTLASRVMFKNLQGFDKKNITAYDTYANLLYKIGNNEEAIKWEKKAVDMSNGEKEFVETLEKMKKGIPTWKHL